MKLNNLQPFIINELTEARFFRGSAHLFGVAGAFDGVTLVVLEVFEVLEMTVRLVVASLCESPRDSSANL